MSQEPVVHPLHPVVLLLAAGFVIPELIFALGGTGFVGGPGASGWRLAAIQDYGFYGQIIDDGLERGIWTLDRLKRFVTYPFVHLSLTQALFAGVFVLALGKSVSDAFGGVAAFLVFFVSPIAGALAFGLVFDDPSPLVGGYPGAYGLIGAFTYLLAAQLAARGERQVRAFMLIGVLLGIQLLFTLLFGSNSTWIADAVGFAAGFLLSGIVRPGGWAGIVARIRRS